MERRAELENLITLCREQSLPQRISSARRDGLPVLTRNTDERRESASEHPIVGEPEEIIVKSASLVLCISFALSGSAIAQQTTGAQGNASGTAGASIAADKNGANASGAAAGSASATTDRASANLDQGVELDATLSKSVDARNAKPGDEVTAVANEDIKSDGRVVIRKGSKLMGHVTTARPLSTAKESAQGSTASQLVVVFDRAVLKDGREVPLNATVQALAAAQSSASMGMHDANAGLGGAGAAAGSARSSGGGLVGGVAGGASGTLGGVAGSTGGVVNATTAGSMSTLSKSSGAVGGLNAAGRFTSGAKGVFGMKGIDVTSATGGSAEGSVLSSSSRTVRLDRGTRMLLVQGSGESSGAIESSKSASGLAGSAAGAANASGAANRGAVEAAGDATGAASVTRSPSSTASPAANDAPRSAREPVDPR